LIEMSLMRTILAALTVAVTCSSTTAQLAGDAVRGRVYAMQVCAECHAIENSAAASPNSGAARFLDIANTPGMTEIALSAFLFTPHRSMPNLIVPPADARDLIAYVLSLRRPPPL
jgi:mono/diheme cytochrome c family protein